MDTEKTPITETIVQQPKQPNFIFELGVNFTTALLIFFLFYFFIAQTHEVHGASMQPNFMTGDRVVTEKVTKYFSSIQRGEVIVLHSPSHSEPLIKRVIALPGETILIENGEVYVDGVLLTEPYIRNTVETHGHRFLREGTPFTLGDDEYVVMGDNRPVSSDSRSWGTITKDKIVGRVLFRYWPLDRFGSIPIE